MSKGKELWRVARLFLLFFVISNIVIGVTCAPLVFRGLSMHMSREAIEEQLLASDYYKLSECLAYLLIIVIFIRNRYVRMSLERIGRTDRMDRRTLSTAIGIAAMIGVGCFFSSLSFWAIIGGLGNIFPQAELDELDKEYGLMSKGILGILNGVILAPISEEILYRGIMLRSMLKMRWHPWIAIPVSAFIFAVIHGTAYQTIDILPYGIITGWLYWRTKSLLPGIVIHMVNNFIAFVPPQFIESGDDDTEADMKVWIIMFAISIALLAYGINWYRKKTQYLESNPKMTTFVSVNGKDFRR